MAHCAAVLAFLWQGGAARAAQPVELELVLAIDVSSSVDAREFRLQMHGLAQAFRHPGVAGAIESAGDLGIAVTLVQWSGNRMHLTSVDWTVLRDAGAARAFAAAVDRAPRLLKGFTGLGAAIRYSLKMIEENAFEGRRKVIDISGDGTSSGLRPDGERDRAVRRGATINGVAILNQDPDLAELGLRDYYAQHVIGGDNACLMTARDFSDFAVVIRRKLIREITGPGLARLETVGP
ncbi:MAG: DUF1194 domain-containing protein, partial [Hyphomicrobiales bacterium]